MDDFLAIAPEASKQQAAHFLELAKGDLQAALESYYDSKQDMDFEDTEPASPPRSSPPPSASSAASKKNPPRKENRITSFADLQNEPEHDSEEDEGQEFFAGGKASGVALQGPPSAKKPTQGTIENILKTAYENGMKKEKEETQSQSQTKKSKTFHGSGNRLGDGSEPEPAPEPQQQRPTSQASAPAAEGQAEEPSYKLTFWEDGFSIDDGPLRDYKDPANEEFLRSMEQGVLPRELKAKPNEPVKVVIEHRIKEKYVPPKKVLKPFSGSGNRLGSEPVEGSPSTSTPAPAPLPQAAPAPAQPVIAASSSSEPLTSIQIRLADGTRLVAKFNPTQTIEDIYRFVNGSRAGESQRNYVLMTTFPNKELTDRSLTLQQASLLNALVVQKYK